MTGWNVNERALKEAFKDSVKVLFQRLFVDTEWHHPQRIGQLGTWSEFVASRMFVVWRRVPNLLRALMNVDFACGVVRPPPQTPRRGDPVGQGALKVENTEICCEFTHTGGCSSDRREYYGSVV
jgi:hypothetical protein